MTPVSRRALLAAAARPAKNRVLVLASADAEWRVVRARFPAVRFRRSVYGEFFATRLARQPVAVVQGGWGKVSAAASAQWAISAFDPEVILNIGTCGGIEGRIRRFDTVLATRTAIYDIREAMGDSEEALRHYSVELDTRWAAETPVPVVRAPMLSADRDLVPADIAGLVQRYGALAVDWESGAIAWVASRNQKRVAIVRGVTDVVSASGSPAYGNEAYFAEATSKVMTALLDTLPDWVRLLTAGL